MSFGKSSSGSRSNQFSTGNTFVMPGQVPFLEDLYGQTQDVMNQQRQDIEELSPMLAQRLREEGQRAADTLQPSVSTGDVQQELMAQANHITPAGSRRLTALANRGHSRGERIAGRTQQNVAQGGQFRGTDVLAGVDQGTLAGTPQLATEAGRQQLMGTQGLQNMAASQFAPSPALTDFATNTGQLTNQLLAPNPALEGQFSALDAAIQQNLESTLGTLSGNASLAGASGGGRADLAAGMAARQAQQEFSAGASNLVSQDFAARQALAPQLATAEMNAQLQAAGLAQQGTLTGREQQLGALAQLQQGDAAAQDARIRASLGMQAGDLAGRQTQLAQGEALQRGDAALRASQLAGAGALQTNDQARFQQNQQAATALQAGDLGQRAQELGAATAAGQLGLQGALGNIGSMQSIFNMGMAPFTAQFAPLLAANAIFGAPTILSEQESTTRSRASGRSVNLGFGGGDT